MPKPDESFFSSHADIPDIEPPKASRSADEITAGFEHAQRRIEAAIRENEKLEREGRALLAVWKIFLRATGKLP